MAVHAKPVAFDTVRRVTPNELIVAGLRGFAWMLGLLFITPLVMIFWASAGADYPFALTLRFLGCLMPFSGLTPAIPSPVAWTLTAAYWVAASLLIGVLTRPKQRIKTTIVAVLVVLLLGLPLVMLMRMTGRFVVIEF